MKRQTARQKKSNVNKPLKRRKREKKQNKIKSIKKEKALIEKKAILKKQEEEIMKLISSRKSPMD